MQEYHLGNCLRGFFSGKFEDQDTALELLSRRFLLSFPAPEGRHVLMYVNADNAFGYEQQQICFKGVTELECSVTDDEVRERCKKTFFLG